MISIAAAGTALAFAAPASAQYHPAQSQAYGYDYQRGGVRMLQRRVDRIQYDIDQLRARRIISRDEANGLRSESRGIERRLYRAGRDGLHRGERRDVERRIARLESHVRREATDGRGWGNNQYGNGQYGNGQYGNGHDAYSDRDRDGRNDRYEDDRGRDRDD
jgi:hypothetical protein